ncbi:MAG: DUF5615 family PIN-like protein [Caldilineaceae bacterium]|nr:DUF5615 family PIN-like protein [Caldilineaceae bacterium]HRJ42823.1 DUF5615 family PIN-like protein [Caldilineaceae bacterium]
MKLLFDQNLSPKLVQRLADILPGSQHVSEIGLGSEDDQKVWRFAQTNGFTVVTKDADYNDLSVLFGSPPQIIWLRLGNCTTAQVERCLRRNIEMLEALEIDSTLRVLELL